MTPEAVAVMVTLAVSNTVTLLMCVLLWGRVRHLEGLIEGRQIPKPEHT